MGKIDDHKTDKGQSVRYTMLIALFISLMVLSGCESEPPKIAFDEIDLSAADAGSGEKLFGQANNDAPACTSCHSVEGGGSGDIGPSLADIANVAGDRVDGQSAEEFLYWSILRPSKHLTAGYSNLMYAKYEEAFEAADIADLIAYLMTLK